MSLVSQYLQVRTRIHEIISDSHGLRTEQLMGEMTGRVDMEGLSEKVSKSQDWIAPINFPVLGEASLQKRINCGRGVAQL